MRPARTPDFADLFILHCAFGIAVGCAIAGLALAVDAAGMARMIERAGEPLAVLLVLMIGALAGAPIGALTALDAASHAELR